jgi:hypothetical protein
MNFGSPTKFDFARRVAAAVGYVALCGFDRVSIQCFPTPGASMSTAEAAARGGLRSIRGKTSAMTYFNALSQLTAGGPADFNASLRRGALEARQAGAALVLSDFLDPAGYEAGLTALIGRGFQVTAIQILAPEELDPTTFGDLRLVDAETGAETEVTFGKYRMAAYRQTVANYLERLREYCTGRGVRFATVGSNVDLGELLLKQLRSAEVWA